MDNQGLDTCELEFNNVRRDVMAGRSWTELFFLDEATALAAGHRPCFLCRRADALRFRTAWSAGNNTSSNTAAKIDEVLQRERIAAHGRGSATGFTSSAENLPDGAMISAEGVPFVIAGGRSFVWTAAGYERLLDPPSSGRMITPPSTIAALRAGYVATLHPTINTLLEDR